MNYDWIWDAGKVARCCYHCRGCCCYCCWWFWQYHGYMFASCLHHDSIMFAMMFVDVVHSSHIGCFDLCYVYHVFSQDQTCKWPLNENWLQYNACRVYQPSMHAQRLFWTFSPFPTLGIPTPFAIRRAQWRRTWSASGWPGNPVGTKNGDTSVGTKKWGYLWTYTYIIYQLIVIWFNFFLGTFKVGKSWL